MRTVAIFIAALSVLAAFSSAQTYTPASLQNISSLYSAYITNSVNQCGVTTLAQALFASGVGSTSSGGNCSTAVKVFNQIAAGTISASAVMPPYICAGCVPYLMQMTNMLNANDNCTAIAGIVKQTLSFDTMNNNYCGAVNMGMWTTTTFLGAIGDTYFGILNNEQLSFTPFNASTQCSGASFCAVNAYSSYAMLLTGSSTISTTVFVGLTDALKTCGVAASDLTYCGPYVATPAPATTMPSSTPAPTKAALAAGLNVPLVFVAFASLIVLRKLSRN